jgi:hypothetical protein
MVFRPDGNRLRSRCRAYFIRRALKDFAAPRNDDELDAFGSKGCRTAPAQTHARRTDNRRAAPKTEIHFFLA